MSTSTLSLSFKEQIAKRGFVHIPFPTSKDYLSILRELGDIIQVTQIRENSESSRLLSSNGSMDFHTDHYAARYIGWFCNSQSAIGGESVLLDSRSVLSSYCDKTLFLLSQVAVQSHKVFVHDKSSMPLLSMDEAGNQMSIFYAPWLTVPILDLKVSQVFEKFISDLHSITPIEILLSEGDLLIIDNRRILHGRNAFPSGSGRWLTRYWLS